MTQQAFAVNSKQLEQINTLRIAVLQLSAQGYVVRKFSSGPQQPRIEIDLPLAGTEFQVTTDGRFAHSDYLGCRVFWIHEPEAVTA